MDSKLDETNFMCVNDDVEKVGFDFIDENDPKESNKVSIFDDHVFKMVSDLIGKNNFKIIKE